MSFINLEELSFKDSPQLSAQGKLRVATSYSLFDSQQDYGLDTTTLWTATANGTIAALSTNASVTNGSNAVGPMDTNTRATPITVSTTDTHYSVLQSIQYLRCLPGNSHSLYITGVFAAGSGATVSICSRSSTTGSVVDTEIVQSSWNVDKFDGTGVSGITLDFTKSQALFVDAQMLYAGRVRVGFDIGGTVYWAHYFNASNTLSSPTMQTFNLPIRMEGRTGPSSTSFRVGYFDSANGVFLKTTRTTKGGTIQFFTCSAQADTIDQMRGSLRTAPVSTTTVSVTTRRPVLSLRPKSTFNGVVNRAHIDEIECAIRATGNDALYEIVVGGTLTGAAFTSAGTNSIAEYDTSATAISGGLVLKSGFAISGSGSSAQVGDITVDIRNPLVLNKIDSLTEIQTVISIVCTSFSATSTIAPAMNWHEKLI